MWNVGLMSTLPVMGEPDKGFDMLDLGANADNKPEHLVQYAVLGSFYAEKFGTFRILVSVY